MPHLCISARNKPPRRNPESGPCIHKLTPHSVRSLSTVPRGGPIRAGWTERGGQRAEHCQSISFLTHARYAPAGRRAKVLPNAVSRRQLAEKHSALRVVLQQVCPTGSPAILIDLDATPTATPRQRDEFWRNSRLAEHNRRLQVTRPATMSVTLVNSPSPSGRGRSTSLGDYDNRQGPPPR